MTSVVSKSHLRRARGGSLGGLAAVLWDLDGTVVDSEHLWQNARDRLASKHGFAWGPEDHEGAIGRPLVESAEKMRKRGLLIPISEINSMIIADVVSQLSAGPRWRPGALDLLRELSSNGIRNALVTSAFGPVAQVVARQAGRNVFDLVVAGDEVRRGKPDPEAYLTAMRKLGLNASVCLAVEDSPSGIQSALAAGLQVLAVPYMAPLDTDDARVVVRKSLADVSVYDLKRFLD